MIILKTLVVEDEGLARRRLEKMVLAHEKLELIPDSAENGADALKKIKQYQPDLILLDIELKDFNAFEILSKLGSLQTRIIFVTAYSDYAVKAFDVEAIDYLLKPFTLDRFNKGIQRALDRKDVINFEEIKRILINREPEWSQKLVIPEGNTQHFMDGNAIEYIYANGYYVNFIMKNKKKLVRISLKLLEEILPSNFSRINKSTIINRHNIKELVRNKNSIKIIMRDKDEFFVTDKYRDKVEAYLNV